MDTNSRRKLLFGTISFMPKPQPKDSIIIECIDVEDEESEPHQNFKVTQAPVVAPPPLRIVNNVMCIDLIDSEEESSKGDTVIEETITPVRMKGDVESLSHCESFSEIIDDSPTIDKNIIIHENASPAMQPLVIEVSDSKEVSEEEESNCNRGMNEAYEPMNLLKPMFDVEDRSELEAIGFKCKYCQRILMRKDDLKKEYQMHAKERRTLRNKKITCLRCKNTFSSRIEFEWHNVECMAKLQATKRRITRQSVKKCRRKTK